MMLIAELKVLVEVNVEFDEKFISQPLNHSCFIIEVSVRRKNILAIITSSGRSLRFRRKLKFDSCSVISVILSSSIIQLENRS